MVLQPDGLLVTYDPLVTDEGVSPAATPVAYTPPEGSIVGIFGGGNNVTTILDGPGSGYCTNGADNIPFGQVWFCNTRSLLRGILRAGIHIPVLGYDSNGGVCPTVRSFKIVDQDQSDNVQTLYLLTPDGRTAQDNAANQAAFPGSTVIANGSDNTLMSRFVDPAIGCNSWLLPDVSRDMALQPTQATNELQGLAYQHRPVAYIPLGDPMVGPNNLEMVNAYRSSLLQPIAHSRGAANTQRYCNHLRHIAPAFFNEFMAQFKASASPDPAMNLYDFLVARYKASLQLLGCHALESSDLNYHENNSD